jgi:hypothetical protein
MAEYHRIRRNLFAGLLGRSVYSYPIADYTDNYWMVDAEGTWWIGDTVTETLTLRYIGRSCRKADCNYVHPDDPVEWHANGVRAILTESEVPEIVILDTDKQIPITVRGY